MTSKKKNPLKAFSIADFDEALARVIQAKPKELADMNERVAKEAEEIERDAKKHLKDIRAGGRKFNRPFRP